MIRPWRISLAAGLLLFLLPLICSGHGREHHIGDMTDVYPFDVTHRTENKAFIDLCWWVNATIDYLYESNGTLSYSQSNPTFLKDLDPEQSGFYYGLSYGNHRIWFHCGFNGNPRRYAPLAGRVSEMVNAGTLTGEQAEVLWQMVTKEQGIRNRRLIRKCADLFAYPPSMSRAQQEQVNGFVSILYDIHLLGDMETSEKDAIDPVSLYEDIYSSIFRLAGRRFSNYKAARRFVSRLKGIEDRENPTPFLRELKTSFTPFLLGLSGDMYDYKRMFEKKGYVLKKR